MLCLNGIPRSSVKFLVLSLCMTSFACHPGRSSRFDELERRFFNTVTSDKEVEAVTFIDGLTQEQLVITNTTSLNDLLIVMRGEQIRSSKSDGVIRKKYDLSVKFLDGFEVCEPSMFGVHIYQDGEFDIFLPSEQSSDFRFYCFRFAEESVPVELKSLFEYENN